MIRQRIRNCWPREEIWSTQQGGSEPLENALSTGQRVLGRLGSGLGGGAGGEGDRYTRDGGGGWGGRGPGHAGEDDS